MGGLTEMSRRQEKVLRKEVKSAGDLAGKGPGKKGTNSKHGKDNSRLPRFPRFQEKRTGHKAENAGNLLLTATRPKKKERKKKKKKKQTSISTRIEGAGERLIAISEDFRESLVSRKKKGSKHGRRESAMCLPIRERGVNKGKGKNRREGWSRKEKRRGEGRVYGVLGRKRERISKKPWSGGNLRSGEKNHRHTVVRSNLVRGIEGRLFGGKAFALFSPKRDSYLGG